MKILLISDSHGNLFGVEEAVHRIGQNADYIIHCGDSIRETEWIEHNCGDSKVICVRGNCDFSCPYNTVEFLILCGKRIMITHGHTFSVKYTLDDLVSEAKRQRADIVFFGHTHDQTDTTIDGVRLINPGSLGRFTKNCATVEIDDRGNVLVNHIRLG